MWRGSASVRDWPLELDRACGEALIAGDRASPDAGGVPLGISTLTLPPAPSFGPRGRDAVLRLAGCAHLPTIPHARTSLLGQPPSRGSTGPQGRVSSMSISAGVPT